MKSEMWWYAARSAGVLAWVLSAVSVVWGLLLASPSLRRRATEAAVADLHRFLGGLAVGFLAVHVVAVAADTGDGRALGEVLVPFAAGDDRLALALGWLGALALVLVEATSLARTRIPDAVWRRAHYAGFAVFALATVHGAQMGTDADSPALWWPAAALAAAVVGLVVARLVLTGAPLRTTAPEVPLVEVDVRPDAALLERTLEGLRGLDDGPRPVDVVAEAPFAVPPPAGIPARPAVAPAAAAAPAPVRPAVVPDPPVSPGPPPRPLTPSQAVSGALFPGADELAARPVPAEPAPAPIVAPTAPARPAGAFVGAGPMPAPAVAPRVALPVRTPRRLARTTAAAERIDAWRPARADDLGPVAPPAPPTEIDPATGEPDPQAYRKWLREWLAYVESQA